MFLHDTLPQTDAPPVTSTKSSACVCQGFAQRMTFELLNLLYPNLVLVMGGASVWGRVSCEKRLVAVHIVRCRGQSEGAYIRSRLEQAFSISIVCLPDIFGKTGTEPFVIKLVLWYIIIGRSVVWGKRKKKGCWKWVAVLNIKVWSMIWSFCCKLCLTSYHLKRECLVKRL